jgi:hypothetical protein
MVFKTAVVELSCPSTGVRVDVYRMSRYYVPYFTGLFLHVKVSKRGVRNTHPEDLPYSDPTLLISSSMLTPQSLPKFNELCIRRKQTKELLINFIFTFLQEVAETASMFTETQVSPTPKR